MMVAIAKQIIGTKPVKPRKYADNAVLTVGQLYNAETIKPALSMRSLKFKVEESEGYFVAAAVDHAIVTQAKTWLNLMRNIDEAVRLHFKLMNDEKYNLELDIDPEVLSLVRKSAKAKRC